MKKAPESNISSPRVLAAIIAVAGAGVAIFGDLKCSTETQVNDVVAGNDAALTSADSGVAGRRQSTRKIIPTFEVESDTPDA